MAEHHNAEAIVISARIEEELIDVSEEEAAEFLESLGVQDSGVSDLIRAVYHLMGTSSNSALTSSPGLPRNSIDFSERREQIAHNFTPPYV